MKLCMQVFNTIPQGAFRENLEKIYLLEEPLPPPNSLFMVRFCWNLYQNIFMSLPIIINFINGDPFLPPPPSPPSKCQILHLWCDFAEILNNILDYM